MTEERVELEMDEELWDTEDSDSEKYAEIDPDDYLEANSMRILYQTNNFLLPQLVTMIGDKKILDLNPEYQRRKRWMKTQKSRLIESLILNVPIPSIYLYEREAAAYEVMDGQQRLTAICEFFSGKYELSGLKYLPRLNGKKYEEISERVKKIINRASITTVVLLLERPQINMEKNISDNDIRRLIFEKLNTGSTQLNPQEIRHALNPGPFNKAILKLSQYRGFTDSFGLPPYTSTDPDSCDNRAEREKYDMYKKMKDCEVISRYFAIKESENIRGSLKSMIDRMYERDFDQNTLENEVESFKACIDFLFNLFDGEPFKYSDESGKLSNPSVTLFDSLMVAMNELWHNRDDISKDSVGVKVRLQQCATDKDKMRYFTKNTHDSGTIQNRIELAKFILNGRK